MNNLLSCGCSSSQPFLPKMLRLQLCTEYHYKINQFIGKDTIGFLYFGFTGKSPAAEAAYRRFDIRTEGVNLAWESVNLWLEPG